MHIEEGEGRGLQNVPQVGPRVVGAPRREHPQNGVPLFVVLPPLLLCVVLQGGTIYKR